MFLDYVPAPAAIAAPAEPERGGAEISVLTYNIRGLPWPLASHRAEALKAIGEELAQMRREGRQPTVVLIQEGFRHEVAGLVVASGYANWARGPARGDRTPRAGPSVRTGLPDLARGEGWGKFTGGGLHVLSDLPIVETRRIAYRACAGWDCLANKGAVLVRVRLADAPVEIELLNTHMNSRRSAGVSRTRSSQAHNRQTDELIGFVSQNRSSWPLIVGGDFNVKDAPERYDYQAKARPYTVVSEYCSRPQSGCGGEAAATARPWLASHDLQAFDGRGVVSVAPESTGKLFADGLSDHDGYLVRYRLSWNVRQLDAHTSDRPLTVAAAAP